MTALAGCPRQAMPTASNESASLEHLSAVMEELQSRAKAENVSCADWCMLSQRMSQLSKDSCMLAKKNAESAEAQNLCAKSQEELARFNEQCSSCR
jgi:FMN-dependent NADH-azoreductase